MTQSVIARWVLETAPLAKRQRAESADSSAVRPVACAATSPDAGSPLDIRTRSAAAALPEVVYDLVAACVSTRERLTVLERVCVAWRRASNAGHGWQHNVDLSWAESDPALHSSVRTRLSRAHRVQHLSLDTRLFYAWFGEYDAEAPPGTPSAAVETESDATVAMRGTTLTGTAPCLPVAGREQDAAAAGGRSEPARRKPTWLACRELHLHARGDDCDADSTAVGNAVFPAVTTLRLWTSAYSDASAQAARVWVPAWPSLRDVAMASGAGDVDGAWRLRTLDLLAIPEPLQTWEDLCALLGSRLQLTRVRHVRCYCHALAGAEQSTDEVKGGAVDTAETRNHGAAAVKDAGSLRQRPATTAFAKRVFPRCETLTLASVKYLGGDLAGLDLEAMFPRLTHLHVVVHADVEEVSCALAATATTPTVWELSGEDEGAAAAVPPLQRASSGAGAVEATLAGAVASVLADTTCAARMAWAALPRLTQPDDIVSVQLPKMSHVAHLRVSGGAEGGVTLSGSFAALQSLQTATSVFLSMGSDVELPKLTHLALGALTRPGMWRRLIAAVGGTLAVLFDTMLTGKDIEYLRCCQSLRQLHAVAWGGTWLLHDMCAGLPAVPVLRDAGVYFNHSDLMTSSSYDACRHSLCLSMAAAAPTLVRLTLIDYSSLEVSIDGVPRAVEESSPPGGARDAALPSISPPHEWQVATLDNLAQTRLEFFGRPLDDPTPRR